MLDFTVINQRLRETRLWSYFSSHQDNSHLSNKRFHGSVQYLTAYKHKLLELEQELSQVMETSEQTEQKLLMEKTSHEDTRIQLQNRISVQERTQHELEGMIHV